MNVLVTLLVSSLLIFAVGSTAGYVAHRLMHIKALGRFAKSHKVHHKLYTPDNFESDTYRSAGKDTSTFVFVPVILLSVVLLGVTLWFAFQVWWIYPVIIAEGIAVGVLNEKIHDWFHIKDHWMNRYAWFKHLKHLHMQHHIHPKKNMGIIWFLPDRVFGTFKK